MRTNKVKKIIIISEYYAPENAIGAVRMSKITKFLNYNSEYDILVISKKKDIFIKDEILERDVRDKANIVRISGSKTIEKINLFLLNKFSNKKDSDSVNWIKSCKNKFKSKFLNVIKFILFSIIDPMIFKRRAIKYLKTIGVSDYSVVISSYGPLTCHWIARKIKQIDPQIQWIADFRDPIFNIFTPFFFKKFAQNYARHVTKNADVVVAVSSGYMDALFLDEEKNKCVITNGYDMEDLKVANFKIKKINELVISYSGVLYAGRRDLSILFKAIFELYSEGKIDIGNIRVHYAGKSGSELLKQARKYGMESIILDKGYISRTKSLELQMNSDALLLATWNTSGGLGNIPGKFFEYMMMNKPIICLTTGEVLSSEIKGIIQTCNLGFCYEEANSELEFEDLKEYIYYLYKYKVNDKQSIPYNPIKQAVESYSYENKAKEFKTLWQK